MRSRVSLTIDESVLKDIDRFIDWYKKTHPESYINRSKLINSLLKYIVEKRDKVVLERVYRDYIHLRDRLGYIRGFYSFFSHKKKKKLDVIYVEAADNR